jgi:hypothetical protein
MQKFSKDLEVASKFWALEGQNTASSSEYPQVLGTTTQNLVACMTWHLEYVLGAE